MTLALQRAGKQTSGPAAPVTKTPDQIAGLEAWYDATVAGSITVVTGVSSWVSQVTGGLTVAQSDTAKQPANGSDINGKNALLFDGSNDSLGNSSGSNLNWVTDKLSIFAAIETASAFSGIKAIAAKANNPDCGNGGTKWSLKINGTGKLVAEIGTTTITTATSSFSLLPSTRYICYMVYDGANINIGTNADAAEATAKTGNMCSNGGAPFCIGRAKYDQEWYKGKIGEAALYSAAITGTDYTGLMAGLVAKWVTA